MEDDASPAGGVTAAVDEAFLAAIGSDAGAAAAKALGDYIRAQIRYAEAMQPAREAFLAGLRAGPPAGDADIPPTAAE